MSIPKDTIWELDPHTKAKHDLLKRYLGAWFAILGRVSDSIEYVDGFCGPGTYSNGESGSPIVALNAALNQNVGLKCKLLFWFIDERPDRIANLKSVLETIEIPENFKIEVECAQFAAAIDRAFDEIEAEPGEIAPLFVFIDPFGFSGIPLSVVERILKNPHCEVLINFMTDSINRFKAHPDEKVTRHITDLFGCDVSTLLEDSSKSGHIAIRNAYHTQLSKLAKWVRFFEMRDDRDRPIYHLFFCTNNRQGFVKMKSAMWGVDPSGGFSFSDRTNQDQSVLFTGEDDLKGLQDEIVREFRRFPFVLAGAILKHIEDNTIYIDKHKTKILRSMEETKIIQVDDAKFDGAKRRKGTFPDSAIIRFT